MAVPVSYTETTLAQYMEDTIEEVGTDLGWLATDVQNDYMEAVNDVELRVHVSDIMLATEPIELVRIYARIAVWKKALAAYVRAYDLGGLQRTARRDQLFQHCRVMLAEAEADLAAYLLEQQQVEAGVGAGPLRSTKVRVVPVW